jgi:catechol 2,3-dioxygenase
MPESIHPDTHIGAVELTISDLDRSAAFYTERIGLKLHERHNGAARFGAGAADLLVLHENREARRVARTTGLYHFAILVPTRPDLAHVLHHIAATETPVQGFADHLVSEAIYLPDPDGNGIEIYRDRPRSEWPVENGQLAMATDPLDLDDLIASLAGRDPEFPGLPAGTVIGHMHLHVRDIPEAERFYHDLIGLDIMARYGPAASFMSAGGYHHHLGVNTWAGQGAPAPPPDAVGLRHFELVLPDQPALDEVVSRLKSANQPVGGHQSGVLSRDLSGNTLLLRTA